MTRFPSSLHTACYLLAFLTLFACSGREKTTLATSIDSTTTSPANSPMEPPDGLPASAAVTPKPSGRATTWQYTKTIDKEGRTVYKAIVVSPTLLEFGFPYTGGSTATLTIRQREGTTHVYIQVSKGQFNRSFQGGQASVRFDGSKPVPYSFSAAENGSANVIFFDKEKDLITRMKATQTMVVTIEFEGQGQRQIDFRTAGLTWNH